MASNITSVYGGRASITFHEAKHYYTVTVPGVVRNLYQPSVTSIIGMLDKSGALVPWAVGEMSKRVKQLLGEGGDNFDREALYAILDAAENSWRKTKQDSADIGSLAHRVLHQELLHRSGLAPAPSLPVRPDPLLAPNLSPDMVDKANAAVTAGLQYLDQHKIEVVQAEAPRWSPTHGFIGTGDLIAKVDDVLSCLDWKTGKRLYSTVKLQLSAYKVAFEEEFPDQEIEQRIGVNITREGVLETEIYENDTHEKDFGTFLDLRDIWRWNQENQGKYSKPASQILGPLAALQTSTTI